MFLALSSASNIHQAILKIPTLLGFIIFFNKMKTSYRFQLKRIKCWMKVHIKEWAPPFWVGFLSGIVFICIL